ncbi:hypothetical protein [Xenorhabdus sp. KJ12.1]|uniref:hypothetical protein n=1 Tax=Xenorhabdus sp. KJ12.1 TaxID=1851571 RepID=UPI000C04703E|nr:hypothetical protein [Xenorhabdus sp. KJ12.1]PHM67976.1 hypothetical protein Xekj_03699 [Xenorhabdus sp. KJ12.1]
MYQVYMLSPSAHKSMERERDTLGRETERHLNTNGRWSGFPPKRDNRLLYWSSFEEAQQAANQMMLWRKRKINVSLVGFSDQRILERLIPFEDKYIPCLQGYQTNKVSKVEIDTI